MTGVGNPRSHPPRTFLFVPGSDAAKIAKARTTTADVTILDLEDGVSGPQKALARRQVSTILAQTWPAGGLAVRVNAAGTSACTSDLEAISTRWPQFVLVPKVEEVKDLLWVQREMHNRGAPEGGVEIVVTLETPKGILAAASIASFAGGLTGLFFGSADYCAALGIQESKERRELDYPRSHVAMVAAAHGLMAIDCPFYQGLDNLVALREDVRHGRQFGYTAKAAIHPKHLQVINEVFSPGPQEVRWAQRVVEAHEEAMDLGRGATELDDSVIDEPIVEQARKVLSDARHTSGSSATGKHERS